MRAEMFFALLNGCGAMALVAILFGQIERLRLTPFVQSCLQGLLFGSGAAVAIYSGTQVLPGFFVDARSIFVAFSGAFAGPLAAVVTMLIALMARLLKGGDGMYAAIVALPIAAAAGLLWRSMLGQRKARLLCLLGLGIAASSTLLVSPFFIALDQLVAMSGSIAMVVATNLTLAIILGSFIERERRHRRREAQLYEESRIDPLTGLLNRRSLEAPANQMLSGANFDYPVSLLAMDLDHFKDINDRYGHAFGDEVLKSAAALIAKITHQHGLVARIGGEEFVAVLGVGEDTARAIARAIQRDMDLGGMLFGRTPVRATISIGVVTFNGETNFDYAFPKADLALYAAKRLGRNRVEYAPTEPRRLAA